MEKERLFVGSTQEDLYDQILYLEMIYKGMAWKTSCDLKWPGCTRICHRGGVRHLEVRHSSE
jgi:hypothetical protein